MKLSGKLTIINYKSKSFKKDNGESIQYSEISFHDDEGNKLTATVPKVAEENIELEKDQDNFISVTGQATFEIVAQSKNGANFPKLKLVEFVV